jgi:XTP/dITP diphosphohydrolase
MDLVLATSNPHKLEEMNAIFGVLLPGKVRFIGLKEAAAGRALVEPAETGSTFEENATIKAVSYAQQTGRVCLADDSGLEIDALQGRPGVISSHYCTDGREAGMSRAERDGANNERVLREMAGVPWEERGARFVCVMVVAEPAAEPGAGRGGRVLHRVRGTFEGRIGYAAGDPANADPRRRVPRGERGFGYDPLILVPPGYEQTSAELAPDEKNARSHRGAAARLLTAELLAMPRAQGR